MLDELDKLMELIKTIRILDEEKCFLPINNYSDLVRYGDINKVLNELFKKIIKIILESDSLEDYRRLGVINIELSDKKRGKHLLNLKKEIDETIVSYNRFELQETLVYSFYDDPDSKIIIDTRYIINYERKKRLTMF